MKRFVRISNAVGVVVDRLMPTHRWVRRSAGLVLIWAVFTVFNYVVSGTKDSPSEDTHIAGHWLAAAAYAALMTAIVLAWILWQDPRQAS